MLTAKTGNWFVDNPQRGRSNNSVILLRDETTEEEFISFMEHTKNYGEPGVIWSDSLEFMFNPCVEISLLPFYPEDGTYGYQACVSGDTKLITKESIVDIKSAAEDKKEISIWNGTAYKKVVPFKTGESDTLYRVSFSDGSYLDVTSNHRFLVKNRFESKYNIVETSDLIDLLTSSKYALQIPRSNCKFTEDMGVQNNHMYEYGYVLGDGGVTSHQSKDETMSYYNPTAGVYDGTGKESINFNGTNHLRTRKNTYGTTFNVLSFNELDNKLAHELKYQKGIPVWIFELDKKSILDFIAGWADADGSQASKGIRIYGEESKIRDAQLLLTKVGIESSVNIMAKKGTIVKSLIEAVGREIERKQDVFYLQITRTIEIPCQRLICDNSKNASYKGQHQIIKSVIVLDGKHESYCLSEPETEQCVFNNVLTMQCNLTEINGALSTTKEIFFAQCKVASILGTLQAGYTDFKFFKDSTKKIVEKEALIGVGITGMMNNPDILFNEEILREGARIVKYWNKTIAKIIGINVAARTTTIKPSGNASVILMCSSGIHGEHSKKYLRHVQFNKDTEVAKIFQNKNRHMCEDSVWNSERDIVVAFPISPSDTSIFKKDLLGIKQLEYVKLVQNSWIEEGTNVDLCTDKRLRHNVSNTITVDDWDATVKYIYDNRQYLCGVSLLAAIGDKAYPQAPFTEVLEYKDIVQKYGEVSLFTSALIEIGLKAFNNNLWMACDTALSRGQKLTEESEDLLKRDFVRRFNKFSVNFKDSEECSNCLKDVYNLHKYWSINKNIKDIDWDKELKKKEFVDIDTIGAINCNGNSCEIVF